MDDRELNALLMKPIEENLASGDAARIESALNELLGLRGDALPFAPLDFVALAKRLSSFDGRSTLLEVIATYPFVPPLSAEARAEQMMRVLLSVEDGPAYRAVLLLRADGERAAAICAAVRAMRTGDGLATAERVLEELLSYEEDHAAIAEGAEAWPADHPLRSLLK